MRLNLQMFGGRGASSGGGGGNFTAKDFKQTSPGVWESKAQVIDAVGISRTGQGGVSKALKSTDAAFRIIKDGDKYKTYQTLFGGKRQFIKSGKSLDDAISIINKKKNNK